MYTLNRVSNSTSEVTPYQSWHGTKPDVSHLRIFGSIAFIHVPKAERRKLDSKSLKCIFVGYSLSQKAYRFWDVIGRKIKISRDVIFDELFNAKPDFSTNLEREDFLEILPKFSNPIQAPQPTDQASLINLTPPVAGEILETQQEPSRAPNVASPGIIDTSEDTSNSTTPPENNDSASSPPRTRFSPYPLRNRQPRQQWQSLLSFDSQEDEIYEPTSYSDAMKSPDAELWKAAIQDEMKSLMTNKTWSLSELPPGRKCTLSRWVLKVKPATPGSPARYKARLVAKGFSQRPGIDFEETFRQSSNMTHSEWFYLLSPLTIWRCLN